MTASRDTETILQRLIVRLDHYPRLAIALSGGVDSMMLAYIAHRFSQTTATMYHASGPAVPRTARARLELYALRHGWNVVFVGTDDLNDTRYRTNPVDRCYYCKSNLYTRLRELTVDPIAAGTNTDDLSDYRPGLQAADEHAVIHPYVEAGLAKADIYALAAALGCSDLERLPAQPCLASRIETGVPVTAEDLAFVDRVENALALRLGLSETIRCRITHDGVVIELDTFQNQPYLESAQQIGIEECRNDRRTFLGVRPYRRGAAFLHGDANV